MKNLYQKINDIMKAVSSVNKGVTITMPNGRSYTGTSHDDVTSLLHDYIANAGIILAPNVIDHKIDVLKKEKEYQGKIQISYEYMASVVVELVAINSENPDEKLSVKMPAMALDSSDKAYGKAISMATKYCYLKLFMLESCDEEESRPGSSYQVNKPNPNYKAKYETLEKLKTELSTKTKGMATDQKQQFLKDNLKVNSFKDVEKMSNDELVNLYNKLSGTLLK